MAFYQPSSDHIPNPGGGICCYATSDHLYRKLGDKPEKITRKLIRQMAALEFCDVIYLRPEWRELQRRPGRLDLPPVWDWAMEAAAACGKRIAFRVMPSNPQCRHAASVPEFLAGKIKMIPYQCATEKNANNLVGPYTKYYPAYTGDYLDAWRELLFLLAEKFDHIPMLEFADISGYGYWGEWHHRKENPFRDNQSAAKVGQRLIDDHLRAFKQTPAAMMVYVDRSPHGPLGFSADYAMRNGCWVRRDAMGGWLFSSWDCAFHDRVRKPGTGFIIETGPFLFQDREIFEPVPLDKHLQSVLDCNVNYLGLGFNPWHAMYGHAKHYALLRYTAQRISYRLRPAIVWLGVERGTGHEYLKLGLVNDGTAQVPGMLAIHVRHGARKIASVALDPGAPLPGRMIYPKLVFPQHFSIKQKELILTAELRMRGKTYPVRWAVESQRLSPDRFSLRLAMPDNYTIGWRWLNFS